VLAASDASFLSLVAKRVAVAGDRQAKVVIYFHLFISFSIKISSSFIISTLHTYSAVLLHVTTMADFETIPDSSPRRHSSSSADDRKKMKKKKEKTTTKMHDLHLDDEEAVASSSSHQRRRAALEVGGVASYRDDDTNDSASYDSQDNTDDDDDDDDEYGELTDRIPTLKQRSFFLCCRLWRPKERLRCSILLTLTFLVICTTVYYGKNNDPNGSKLRRAPPGAVGVGHAAYDTIESTFIEEYEARLTLYKHRSTGAEFLAFVPDTTRQGPNAAGGGGGYDPKPDKVFGIAFRTKPESSTGVPHILEHSVLCGSRKYPSRDPFAHLLKGSLQTFLNAFTYPDRTVYPVASRNKADFYNLMDVYLDAVFHPRAVEEEGWWVLRQEGWRYDVVGANDDGTLGDDDDLDESSRGEGGGGERDLADVNYALDSMINRAEFEYKGVVFSEMKGAYSDPEQLIERISQTLLFPDNSYRFDSGGDPAVIPTLSREEFVSFYKKYYHPTNSRLFVAGDESDVYHALSAADRYMSPMGYNPDSRKDSAIVYQKRTFRKPVSERRPYAAAPGEGDSGFMFCITWLLNTQPTSSMMQLAWIVLDSLLLGKASSPLTKALEDSNLGESTIGGGLDDSLLQSTFSIGMKGLKKREDVNALEGLIMDTLHKLDSDGFSEDEIASTMNTVEFSLREGGGGLRGMEIFLGALSQWNYDQSPREAIIYEDALKMLKEEIDRTGSNLFQQMIRDTLISNYHRVALELYPSATLEEEQQQDQKIQISTAQSRMSDAEYQNIIDEGIKLKKLQAMEETPEVIASNPRLSINDIDSTPVEYPIHVEDNFAKSGIQLVTHEVESNGIAYVDFGLDVSMVPYDEIILLTSLVSLLNEAGTSDMNDADFRYVSSEEIAFLRKLLHVLTYDY
jgi:Zn-dependent M16 (insulinase) family peptidase